MNEMVEGDGANARKKWFPLPPYIDLPDYTMSAFKTPWQ